MLTCEALSASARAPSETDCIECAVLSRSCAALSTDAFDTPFGAERHLHIGARGGKAHWGIGHAPDADVTLTTDYDTANRLYKKTLESYAPPAMDPARLEELTAFVARRKAEGGLMVRYELR